jgi:hypothetical protein
MNTPPEWKRRPAPEQTEEIAAVLSGRCRCGHIAVTIRSGSFFPLLTEDASARAASLQATRESIRLNVRCGRARRVVGS